MASDRGVKIGKIPFGSEGWMNVYFYGCGGLSENVPHSLMYLDTWSSVGGPVVRLRRGNFNGEVVLLGLSFENVKTPAISGFLSLLCACGSRCDLLAFRTCHHACCLLPCLPVTIHSHSSKA